ncbi:MAG: SCO family protein [Aaplasma endosymbiont of Hyalomma asiaticum]
MKIFKTVSNLLLLVATVFLGYSYVNKKGIFSGTKPRYTGSDSVVEQEVVLAAFENLVRHDGKLVSSADYAGKHMLVIFGFSACKHICPAELGIASQLLNRLGTDADKLQVVFITVDPENDTVEKLHDYHRAFDERIHMLTGDVSVIRNVVENYKVYVGRSDTDSDIDHSSFMYLIDKSGKYVGHFSPDLNEHDSQSDKLFSFVYGYLNS